jgi:hypothetical protein
MYTRDYLLGGKRLLHLPTLWQIAAVKERELVDPLRLLEGHPHFRPQALLTADLRFPVLLYPDGRALDAQHRSIVAVVLSRLGPVELWGVRLTEEEIAQGAVPEGKQ